MKTLRLSALLGVAAVVGISFAAGAQTAAPIAPAKTETAPVKQRAVKLKNVPSALVAYWLDPAHNTWPVDLGRPDKDVTKTEAKSAFDLPGSITQIVSVDPQNVILIAGGSNEDFRQLMELIDVLDQPMRQIEIEAQVVAMNPEDTRTFGFDFSKTPDDAKAQGAGKLTLKVGTVRNNYTARLNALVADNGAKIISAQRATVFNNFRVELPLETNRFILLTPVAGGPNQPQFVSVPAASLKVLPTINGDGSISLAIEIARKLPDLDANSSHVAATVSVPVRDGDTIVLSNLAPLFPQQSVSALSFKVPLLWDGPFIGGLFRAKNSEDTRKTFIFITTRILRSDDNDEPEKVAPQQ